MTEMRNTIKATPAAEHYVDPTGDQPCTQCGHFGTGQVPGCTCPGCDDAQSKPADEMSDEIPAKGQPGYMSCPRRCGVDIRGHHSSDQVNGGCDTGPMAVADMMEWFDVRGVGRPGCYTMAEAIAEFYGKSEDELERFYNEICGPMA